MRHVQPEEMKKRRERERWTMQRKEREKGNEGLKGQGWKSRRSVFKKRCEWREVWKERSVEGEKCGRREVWKERSVEGENVQWDQPGGALIRNSPPNLPLSSFH